MRLWRMAWTYLWSQPLTAALNLLLLSLGLGAISFVIVVSEQLDAGMRRDLQGIDLVVGAKGSPMQIMLAGVFHLDVPTGNIPLDTLETLRAHPLVARA
ncbi:MAG: ABC transporter permease, partial [Burkholderiaceae bacterium]|nr:ABC transporter permease [Burkholderiaceae bacterium]